MDVNQQIAQQIGSLVMANISLAAQVEALKAKVQELTPKPEPYPDKNLSPGD